MTRPSFSIQPLESRTLLSFSSFSGLLGDPTIVKDRQAVQDAFDKLRSDGKDNRGMIRDDQKAVRDELAKLATDKGQDAIDAAVKPLKDKLRTDEKAKSKELRGDVQALRAAGKGWAKTLFADAQALRAAKKAGVQADIDKAQAQLTKDTSAADAALKPLRDEIMADKNKWRPIITADHDAIEAKLEDLDPALKPLFTKLDTDASALDKKLTDDAATLSKAVDQLTTDIKAWRDAHKPTATTT